MKIPHAHPGNVGGDYINRQMFLIILRREIFLLTINVLIIFCRCIRIFEYGKWSKDKNGIKIRGV